MEIGDRVIINPNVPDRAWSKNGYGFYYSTMRKPGIFVLEEKDSRGSGGFVIDSYIYDEEWLLPVPFFQCRRFCQDKRISKLCSGCSLWNFN